MSLATIASDHATHPPYPGARRGSVPPGSWVHFTSADDRHLLGDERLYGAEVECAVVRDGHHLGRRGGGLQGGHVIVPEFRHRIDVHRLRGDVRPGRLLEDEG